MGRTDCRDILEMALCAFRFSEGGETEPSFSSGRLVPKDDFCALGAILILSHDSSHQSQDQVDAIAGQGRELGAKARDRVDPAVGLGLRTTTTWRRIAITFRDYPSCEVLNKFDPHLEDLAVAEPRCHENSVLDPHPPVGPLTNMTSCGNDSGLPACVALSAVRG